MKDSGSSENALMKPFCVDDVKVQLILHVLRYPKENTNLVLFSVHSHDEGFHRCRSHIFSVHDYKTSKVGYWDSVKQHIDDEDSRGDRDDAASFIDSLPGNALFS